MGVYSLQINLLWRSALLKQPQSSPASNPLLILHSLTPSTTIFVKNRGKDPFYNDFVPQPIIKMFGPFGVWQGGGVAYLNELDKPPFYMYDNAYNRTYAFIRQG